MRSANLLRSFEYDVMPSVSLVSIVKTTAHPVAEHLPLLRVKINFKNGKLIVEGDWHFLMASNRQTYPWWFSLHSGRVVIDAEIYPAASIDLTDDNNDGLVFVAEGIIHDGSNLNGCSGLVVLEKLSRGTGISNHEWNIIFYLSDYQRDNCEIRFKLPVYTLSGNKDTN